jgi:monovalent cation:proton antiporter-2 (CPA2) family protein
MFFLSLLIILLATKLAGDLSVRLGQPAVLGKLVIGAVIGPAMLGWVENDEIVQELSQIGVLLLMFLAGLETDLQELNRNRRASVAVALGGIFMPLGVSFLAGSALGMDWPHAVFMGLLLSATSVSITVQTLKELHLFKSRESAAILGAAILDDIAVVILLAVAMSFIAGADINLGLVIGKKLLFFLFAGLLIWQGTGWVIRRFARLRVSETVVSAGLVICFFFAYVAESLGVAGIIGAFCAGLAISRTEFRHRMEEKVSAIAYAVFVPIFFAGIGFSMSFAGLAQQVGFIALFTVIAVLTKLAGAGAGALLTGFSLRSSAGIGAGMVSRGEVALIIAALGLETGLLPQDYFTAAVFVVILTTMMAPPLIKWMFRHVVAAPEEAERQPKQINETG